MRDVKRGLGALMLLAGLLLLNSCASGQNMLAPGETLKNDSAESAWVLLLREVPPGSGYVNSGSDTLKVIPNRRLLYLYLNELLREAQLDIREEKLRALDEQLREAQEKLEALEKP